MNVSDISTFFNTSTRDKNDATNKVRESILKIISNPPKDYLDNTEFGEMWSIVNKEWNNALKKIAEDSKISYTSTSIKVKGGRNSHYDADIIYYNGSTIVSNKKIEFKNGGSNIGDQPQFLSLPVKFGLFSETYDTFWYNNYLDTYIACDKDITEPKPQIESYLKYVTRTTYSINPFFNQLKDREDTCKKEKNEVVNKSISDYLIKYGNTINIQLFKEKVKATQSDKIYLLWCNGKFCIDKISDGEMSEMSFHSIKNGNVIELKSGNTMYGLLLRWRNHKGILNPAWQISMKRCK